MLCSLQIFSLLLRLYAIRIMYGILSLALNKKPEINPLEPGITATERKYREAILNDFNNRSNLAIRFLTKAIKNNADLISALANDSTPNLTKNPAIYYRRICAHVLPNFSLSISNIDDEFNKVVNDKFKDGNIFLRKLNIVANPAIALGVYKRDNVLKTKFAKALCYNDITLKVSLLSSAMVDSQTYGDFCTHAVILYNTATANRSVSDTQTDDKKAGGKDVALVARFNNIQDRMAGRVVVVVMNIVDVLLTIVVYSILATDMTLPIVRIMAKIISTLLGEEMFVLQALLRIIKRQ